MRPVTLSIIALTIFTLSACGDDTDEPATGSGQSLSMSQASQIPDTDAPVDTAIGFAEALRERGISAMVGELNAKAQPIFPRGVPSMITVDEGSMQVYVYGDEETAQADAGAIAQNADTVRGKKVAWVGSPHFYGLGKMIVVYLGSNDAILETLDELAGAPFAEAQRESGSGSVSSN
jgi:hypothetical protein